MLLLHYARCTSVIACAPSNLVNSVNVHVLSSSFLSWFLSFFSFTPPCFVLYFLPFVLVIHCWERCHFGQGEIVTGQWWLLQWLVRYQRYTRYAMLLGECVSWSVCVISTYGSTWSVRFIRMKLIHILILHIRINLIRMVYRFWIF